MDHGEAGKGDHAVGMGRITLCAVTCVDGLIRQRAQGAGKRDRYSPQDE
jgi:hypothetical protein